MKKKMARLAAGVLALMMVVGSWAFYTSTNTVDNQLQTDKYGDTITEKFTPDLNWQPGEDVTKEAGVKNTGDYDLVVRVKLNEVWWRDANANGTMDTTEKLIAIDSTDNNGADMAKINYTTTPTQGSATDGGLTGDQTVVKKALVATGWTAGTDGYWYYNSKLAPNASAAFMTAITLANETDMGKYTTVKYWTESTTVSSQEPSTSNIGTDSTNKWVVYTGPVPSPTVATNEVYTRSVSSLDATAAGYAGAYYDLFVTSETCQATSAAVAATWTTAPSTVVTGWGL